MQQAIKRAIVRQKNIRDLLHSTHRFITLDSFQPIPSRDSSQVILFGTTVSPTIPWPIPRPHCPNYAKPSPPPKRKCIHTPKAFANSESPYPTCKNKSRFLPPSPGHSRSFLPSISLLPKARGTYVVRNVSRSWPPSNPPRRKP